MSLESLRRPRARWILGPVVSVTLAIGLLNASACASSSSRTSPAIAAPPAAAPASAAAAPEPPMPVLPTAPPSPDLRVGLAGGTYDAQTKRILTPAAEGFWNMRVLSKTAPPEEFLGVTNSDLAFTGKYAIQGNYNGYQVWDISNPAQPTLAAKYLCPASQSDVSVYRNLVFVSGEGRTGRLDCGAQGVPEPVSKDRLRGIRIFDIRDVAHPKYIANVQTCRGSHTHTVVTDPNDNKNVYIYVSGSSGVRSPDELPGCTDGPIDDPNSARFRIEVIRVPLAAPQQAAIVSSPRIFNDLPVPPRHADPPDPNGRGGRGRGAAGAAGAEPAAAAGRGEAPAAGRGAGGPPVRTGPNQCHDITVYPAIGLAGGACGGYGLLLDIRDVAHPKRIDAAADENMSFWHSATFSNDGSKILFTDEWGGGTQPRCRDTDKHEWGADALFTIVNGKMQFKSYYKIPAVQTPYENCVAHNGSLIPIPGREVMVQAWYQGGISVFDWTDLSRPTEIAYFDRGPLDATKLVLAGSWSVYWYNGYLVSSEIARGLDVFELTPSGHISKNEIDAARTVHLEYLNAQEQPKITWPPSFPLVRAYLDQLARSNGLASERIAAARSAVTRAEHLSGNQRKTALAQLAAQLSADAAGATDQAKVKTLSSAVSALGSASH